MQRKIIITKLDYDTGYSSSTLDEINAEKFANTQILREYLLRNQYAGRNKNEVTNDLAITNCIEFISQYPHDPLIPYMLGTLFYVRNDLILGHFYLAKSLEKGNESIRTGAASTLAAICFHMLQSDTEKLALSFFKNTNIADADKNKFRDRLNYHLFILHYEKDKTKAKSYLEKVSHSFTDYKITDLILIEDNKKRDEITYDIYTHLVKLKHADKALEFLKNISDVSCLQKNTFEVFKLLNPNRKNLLAYEEKKRLANKIITNKSTAKPEVVSLAEKTKANLEHPKTIIRYKFIKILTEIKDFHKKITPGLTDGLRGLTNKRNQYISALDAIETQLAYADTKENLLKCYEAFFNLLYKSEYPSIADSAKIISLAKTQLLSFHQLILNYLTQKKLMQVSTPQQLHR